VVVVLRKRETNLLPLTELVPEDELQPKQRREQVPIDRPPMNLQIASFLAWRREREEGSR
jgi:hypothetical protein